MSKSLNISQGLGNPSTDLQVSLCLQSWPRSWGTRKGQGGERDSVPRRGQRGGRVWAVRHCRTVRGGQA